MRRRTFLTVAALAAAGAIGLGLGPGAEANPRARARRRPNRHVRRRIRRRHRRRVAVRLVAGRPVWVVPVGLAAGWELAHADRVVVVKETRIVGRDGAKVEVVVVVDQDGKTDEIEIVREDTTENRAELEGSVLPDDDTKTPGVEGTVDVEAEAGAED